MCGGSSPQPFSLLHCGHWLHDQHKSVPALLIAQPFQQINKRFTHAMLLAFLHRKIILFVQEAARIYIVVQ